MSATPVLPPLIRGHAAPDPLAAARRLATSGCDAGTLVYRLEDGDLDAALILAPDVPLARAAQMLPVAAIGFRDALGVLAPPELAVGVDWDGAIRVNGAVAGALACHAPTRDRAARPDWLIVTLRVDFLPVSDAPGDTPDRTALYAEGCGAVVPAALLEAWARYTLLWITRWIEGERTTLHREYSGLLKGLGAPVKVAGIPGDLIGVDSDFSALLQDVERVVTVPLMTLVQP